MKNVLLALMLSFTAVLIGCGGGGSGSGSSTLSSGPQLVDSWPIYAALSVSGTSYENKNDVRLDRTQLDKFVSNISPISVTFGDFFQEGQFSAFVVFNNSSGQAGEVHFLRWKSSESRWVDDSDRILSRANNNGSACVSSQYAITTDFNLDGKPDVYLSCAKTSQPVEQLLFLSQANGSYVRQTSGFTVDGKSAAALDINADGYVDLIVSNSTSSSSLPYSVGGEPEVYLGNVSNGHVTFPLQRNTSNLIASDVSSNCTGNNVLTAIPAVVNYVGVVPTTNNRKDLILSSDTSVAWLKDLGAGSSPRYSVCQAKLFEGIIDVATLTDVYSSVDAGVAHFYLARKSSPLSMRISRFTLNESSNPTIFHVKQETQPQSALISTSSSDGVPDLFKLTSGYFKAYDAGCTGNRCNALSVALSTIH